MPYVVDDSSPWMRGLAAADQGILNTVQAVQGFEANQLRSRLLQSEQARIEEDRLRESQARTERFDAIMQSIQREADRSLDVYKGAIGAGVHGPASNGYEEKISTLQSQLETIVAEARSRKWDEGALKIALEDVTRAGMEALNEEAYSDLSDTIGRMTQAPSADVPPMMGEEDAQVLLEAIANRSMSPDQLYEQLGKLRGAYQEDLKRIRAQQGIEAQVAPLLQQPPPGSNQFGVEKAQSMFDWYLTQKDGMTAKEIRSAQQAIVETVFDHRVGPRTREMEDDALMAEVMKQSFEYAKFSGQMMPVEEMRAIYSNLRSFRDAEAAQVQGAVELTRTQRVPAAEGAEWRLKNSKVYQELLRAAEKATTEGQGNVDLVRILRKHGLDPAELPKAIRAELYEIVRQPHEAQIEKQLKYGGGFSP